MTVKNYQIDAFRGEYAFLDTYYETTVVYEGIIYRNAEAAYLAQRCQDVIDKVKLGKMKPWKARKYINKVAVRKDWERKQEVFMYEILKAKFQQHPVLRDKLLATYDADLVHGNFLDDTYWGVCWGKGQNKLGKLLMFLREEFRKGSISAV